MSEITEAAVEEALAALPPTADEVAELFAEIGIKGTPGAGGHCPVANYLKQEFPADPRPVFYYDAAVGDVFVPAPAHLFAFARAFDDGAYPDLIA